MPDAPDEIRRLAVGQWTRPVAFRDTIEAMYRDGLRVFVDVGARGNLCGYVEDILRGRPAFAVAANLPRRSGTAQLNHLVASLFAQGLALDASYLYARRRPRRVDLDAPAEPARSTFRIEVGFPEMRLSERRSARLARSGDRDIDAGERGLRCPRPSPAGRSRIGTNGNGKASHHLNGHAHSNGHGPDRLLRRADRGLAEPITRRMDSPDPGRPLESTRRPDRLLEDEPAMLGFLETMNEFLHTQRQVMEAYLRGATAPSVATHETSHCPGPRAVDHAVPEPGPWVGEIVEWEPGTLRSRPASP